MTKETGRGISPRPASIDLTTQMLPAQDQGVRGTCLAFAVTAIHELARSVAVGSSPEDLSEEALYWSAKQIDGDTDDGTSFDSAESVLDRSGQPLEHHWPYDVNRDVRASTPPPAAVDGSNCYRATIASVSVSLDDVRSELAERRAVAIGIPLWTDFYLPGNGELASPDPSDLIGASHAVVIVGYEDRSERIVIRNSWGTSWGEEGHVRLPYGFIEDHVIEAWSVAGLLNH